MMVEQAFFGPRINVNGDVINSGTITYLTNGLNNDETEPSMSQFTNQSGGNLNLNVEGAIGEVGVMVNAGNVTVGPGASLYSG